jgi:uncharacterized membrane protein
MAKPKMILLIGLVILILGIIMFAAGFMSTFRNPEDEAKKTVTLGDPEYSETVNLKKGEYDIWYKEEGFFDWGPGDVTITDSDGDTVYDSSSSSYSESINEYTKKGNFDVDSTGDYTITSESSCTLYLTEPISVGQGIGICSAGIIILIVGIIVMLLGIYKIYTSKKQARRTALPPGPAPGQPPAPGGTGQYPCGSCGQPLRYMPQYQKYYCDNCRRYA